MIPNQREVMINMGAVDEAQVLHAEVESQVDTIVVGVLAQMDAIDRLMNLINEHQGFSRSSHLDDAVADAIAAKSSLENSLSHLESCKSHTSDAVSSLMY